MKTKLSSAATMAVCAIVLSLAVPTPANASLAQYVNPAYANDFSSLTDAGWTHLSIFALSTGQTWSAATGAYRLTAPPNGYNPGNGKYGFVGSTVTGLTIGNGYVQSDVVSLGGWSRFLSVPSVSGRGWVTSALLWASPVTPSFMSLTATPSAGDIRLERLGPARHLSTTSGL